MLLSGSRLDTLICPRRYYHSYIERLERPAEENPRMHAGKAGHAALSVWYSYESGEAYADSTALTVLAESWGDFDPSPASPLSWLTLGHMETVLRDYFDWWRERETYTPIDVDINGSTLASEELVKIEIADALYRGRLDLPVRDASGNIYVMDHKFTSGNMGDYFWRSFEVSNQFRGYAAILTELLGEPVIGVVGNGVYMGRYNRKAEKAFQRRVFDFRPWSLDEFRENVAATQAEIEWRIENDLWPQRTGSRICASCEYLDLCTASPALREGLKQRDYRVKEEQEENDDDNT